MATQSNHNSGTQPLSNQVDTLIAEIEAGLETIKNADEIIIKQVEEVF